MSPRTRTLINWLNGQRTSRMPDLGRREIAILEMLWAAGPASAQAIAERSLDRPVSLSTIQSTLERLHRKRLVLRRKEGRAYSYSARLNRSQLIGALLRDLSAEVAGGEVAPMISGFMDYVSGEDPELQSDLAKLLAGQDDDDA